MTTPIHKFFRKPVPERQLRQQPDSVFWIPKVPQTHAPIRRNGGLRWELFAQREINIEPGKTTTLFLLLGVRMTRGMCLVSLRQELKLKYLSLQDGAVSEDVEDIVITIQNNSQTQTIIEKGASLCFVDYRL